MLCDFCRWIICSSTGPANSKNTACHQCMVFFKARHLAKMVEASSSNHCSLLTRTSPEGLDGETTWLWIVMESTSDRKALELGTVGIDSSSDCFGTHFIRIQICWSDYTGRSGTESRIPSMSRYNCSRPIADDTLSLGAHISVKSLIPKLGTSGSNVTLQHNFYRYWSSGPRRHTLSAKNPSNRSPSFLRPKLHSQILRSKDSKRF